MTTETAGQKTGQDVWTKTGEGRFKKAVRVPDVETLACPDRDGPHWLINRADGSTECRGCRRSWSDLDADLRGAA